MIRTRLFGVIGLFLALVVLASPAKADMITGTITFGGDWSPTGGTGLSDATGVNVLGDDAVVTSSTGDLTGVNVTVTYSDFGFNPFTTPMVLWTDGVFSFELTSGSLNTQTSSTLGLNGSGTISSTLPGLDPTVATWSFSGDTSQGTFAFSSTNTLPVPEPATVLLVGLGLIGIGAGIRRRQ